MPRALPEKIELLVRAARQSDEQVSDHYGLRAAHFIAQVGHETASFLYMEEIASGSAYEGRTDLGNTQLGDGKRFKGRGLIQLNGRANYTAYSKDCGIDYVANPTAVSSDPFVCVAWPALQWSKRKISELADRRRREGRH